MRVVLISLFALTLFAGDTHDDCGGQVCLYPENTDREPSFTPDKSLSRKARAKERKRHRKHKNVSVTVELLDRRGSAFIDGRYVASAGQAVKPGRHELELRDGDQVIVKGLLVIPRKTGSLAVVVHGDR